MRRYRLRPPLQGLYLKVASLARRRNLPLPKVVEYLEQEIASGSFWLLLSAAARGSLRKRSWLCGQALHVVNLVIRIFDYAASHNAPRGLAETATTGHKPALLLNPSGLHV